VCVCEETEFKVEDAKDKLKMYCEYIRGLKGHVSFCSKWIKIQPCSAYSVYSLTEVWSSNQSVTDKNTNISLIIFNPSTWDSMHCTALISSCVTSLKCTALSEYILWYFKCKTCLSQAVDGI
jgi:hypothetical protein